MYNKQIETFLTVIEHGSFNRAARAMYLSVPSVVQQINLLEKRLDVSLLVRSKHGVKLTPEGVVFAQGARKILALSKETQRQMRLVSREFICGTGPRCTAILTSRYWLRIQSRYPDAVLRYRPYDDSNPKEDNLPAFCEAMYHGSRYHQFSNNPLVRDGLFIPALEVEYCLAVPPEHPLAAGDPSEPLQMEMLRGQCLATIRHGVSWDADQLQEELTASCPDISFAAPGDYDHALPGNCRLNCLPVIIPRLWHSMFEGFIIRDVAWKQKSSYGFYCRKDSSPMLMSILQDIASLAQQEEIACKA